MPDNVKKLKALLAYVDWIDCHSRWIKAGLARTYSTDKAEEFSQLVRESERPRDALRRLVIARPKSKKGRTSREARPC